VSLSSSAVSRPGRAVLADVLPGQRVRDLGLVVGYAGLTGLAAQLAIPLPFTPVPVTGQTLVVLLGAAALGWQRALLGMGLYLAAGLLPGAWALVRRSGS
jgi:biotin transport system substrate-specific component